MDTGTEEGHSFTGGGLGLHLCKGSVGGEGWVVSISSVSIALLIVAEFPDRALRLDQGVIVVHLPGPVWRQGN